MGARTKFSRLSHFSQDFVGQMHFHKPRPLGTPFWQLWGSVVTSSLGTGILMVAFPLLSLRFTRSPIAISSVVIAGQAPALLVALPFGAIADRLNRRPLLIAIQLLRFLVLGLFGIAVLTNHYGLALIYPAAFVLGGLAIAFDIAVNASIPSIVHEENIVRANAHLLNAELTSENLLGQAFGGAALALTPSLPFLAEAGGLVVSAGLIKNAVPDTKPQKSSASAWTELREGVVWLSGNAPLRRQMLLIGTMAVGQGMVLGLLALYARRTLHLSNAGYGLLLAIATIGTLIGAAVATRLDNRVSLGVTTVVGTSIVAAGYPILAFTSSALATAAVLIVGEAGIILASTASRSLRQRLVPAEMQGRAASAGSILLMTCVPLGALFGGLLAGATSIRWAFLGAAAVDIACLIVMAPRIVKGQDQPRSGAQVHRLQAQVHTADISGLAQGGITQSISHSA